MSVQRHAAQIAGHRVELVFDKNLVVLNRARLEVDGVEVDSTRVVYGERELTADLPDGSALEVRLHSGMVGELTRAQARVGGGAAWTDLAPEA
ncbi:hypothetical protein ACOACO_05870 [Nocardioides sp. CPCC 205120]|uniref:hypothetical protein n=1 Tax=Nocardioides sp. CPCC 205120 TaxID=3406462 RepID=UPI003B4FFD31